VSKKKPKKGSKEGNCTAIINPSGQVSEWGVRPAAELIVEMCRDNPQATILTCGPNHNLGATIGAGASIHRWVAQGGYCGFNFARDGSEVISKFAGLTHVAFWNFGGSRDATLAALQASQEIISRRVLVGKNVCHACIYDEYFDCRLKEYLAENANDGRKKAKASSKDHQYLQALQWLDNILTAKYRKGGSITNRKALHDLLAFATMIDENVCELVEVAVDVTEDNRWGAVPATKAGETIGSTRTFAAIAFDGTAFVDALLAP
jgi:inosine-uridine nucleoside N-ribohydrolase